VKRKFAKNLLSLFIIIAGIFVFRFAFAQNFGTEAVNSGLGGALSSDDPRTIIGRIINVGLGFLGVIALGLIIYAGFLWMTSGGEEDKISKAKKLLTSAVIGLAIVLASWAIATFVINKLSGAINGNSEISGCTEPAPCGCGGIRACVNGSLGFCIGSDCGGGPGPTTCNANMGPVCQPDDQICSSTDYCAADCTCQPKGEAGASCDGDTSTPQTCDADNTLCGSFLSCDAATCTCIGTPVITNISPAGGFCEDNYNKSCSKDADCGTTCNLMTPNGAPNNFITISGKNFGEYSTTTSEVIFMGGASINGRNPSEINPVCINFWQNDQIIIAVPNGVVSGPIKVVGPNGAEDITNNDYGPKIPDFISNNIARPGLCLISPNKGMLSSSVTYQGINLYNGQAYFGNYQSNVQGFDSNFTHAAGLSGTAATPNIRSGNSGSFVINNMSGNQEKSNFLKFVKEANPNDGPYIVSFFPTAGKSGQYVTITGNGFGWSKGNSRVYFGDVEADYNFPPACASSVWGDKQIIVKVPDDITNGNQIIRITLGSKIIDSQELNPNVFQTNDALSLKTSLCKIEPNQGAISTPVKVYGEYFGQVDREGLVQFSPERSVIGQIKKENRADIISVAVPTSTITGAVKVVKNGEWGNELNFEVSSCTTNAECSNQVCCPANTYKKGRCVNELKECLTDIPTSVFEWGFSTGFVTENPDSQESCKSLATYFGSCQVGSFCPNVPGLCSPYSGGAKRTVANCDFSCISIDGCRNGLGSDCSYDNTINKCVKDGASGICSLSKVQTFNLAGVNYDLTLTCNSDKNWETNTPTSCPDNWTKGVGKICVDKNSSCNICEAGLKCEQVGVEGRCVSPTVCPVGSVCEDVNIVDAPDNCVVVDKPSCDCCCRKDQVAQDCCAATNPETGVTVQLTCDGACGSGNSNLGRCGGCKLSDTSTPAMNDAACNCTGHSGQYCSITPETPNGICTDCSNLEGLSSCSEHNAACCFDSKRTAETTDDLCRGVLGNAVITTAGPDFGYCGYFGCFNTSTPPIGDPLLCASSTMLKIGLYKDPFACVDGCAKSQTDTCAAFNGNSSGCLASGKCCYDSNKNTCSGGSIGPDGNVLCCGCTKDADCAAPTPELVGCGASACCESRPNIIETAPKSGANNVCRNAVLQATFDQTMDISSFGSNVTLLQEMDYGGNTCPEGTFVYEGNTDFAAVSQSWFQKVVSKVKISISKLLGTFNSQALAADAPSPTKLYCSFPGNATGEYIGTTTTLLKFSPRKLLSADAKYFLVIKGDEDLNSQTGVINLSGVGFNGFGFDEVGDLSTFIEGGLLSFNGRYYKNSHIFQFKTLPDSGATHGICAVNQIKVTPASYLFKTVDDDLDENDSDPNNKTFDTKRDKDKVLFATAYSSDNQALQPVTGYFWDWKFELTDPSVISFEPIIGLAVNKVFTSVNAGITDGRTKVKATIDMTRFLDAGSVEGASCSCFDETCSSNCRNAYSGGDNLFGLSNLYIMVCDNPWPSIKDDGTWTPWSDASFGDAVYYCRDAGQSGTYDDLPLLIDEEVVGDQTNKFVCSSDNFACSPVNSACGADKNGDGTQDGICIWSVLKEYFFFRESASPVGEIISLVDKQNGGAVTLKWKSTNMAASSYKIYYGEQGKKISMVQEIRRDNAAVCTTIEDGTTNCSLDIGNLKNGQTYSFFLSVIANKVESPLSIGKNVIPNDKLAPMQPINFQVVDNSTTTIKFSWSANTDDTLFYRIYRGTRQAAYGTSFDTNDKATSTIINKSELTLGANYFAISAIDNYNNESIKSSEITFTK
jgi:hypothetical protein